MSKLDRLEHSWVTRITALSLLFIKSRIFSLLVVVSILLLVMDTYNKPLSSSIKSLIIEAASPILKVITKQIDHVQEISNHISDLLNLRYDNARLKQENALLKYQYTALKQTEIENTQLRKLLNFVDNSSFNYLTSRVVGSMTGPYSNSAIVTAGAKDGVKKGQVVVNSESLVGRITEVNAHTSQILLITDVNSRIPAITLESMEKGIISGNNSEDLSLLYLIDNHKAKLGELVVTSGDGLFFPPGLPIGIIYDINQQEVRVKPLARWNNLGFVSIISSTTP